MDIESSSDSLMLTAEGPVEKTLTYEEGSVTHKDVDATQFTAETIIEGYQQITVTLSPGPDIEEHVESGFEDNHRGLVTWLFASYLEEAEEGWYAADSDQWEVELTTAKPGEHPENLFRLCAEARASRDGRSPEEVLREWASNRYFDTETIQSALKVYN